MIARALMLVLYIFNGKEVRQMLVRLYAGEIILGKIDESDVPVGLKARVHQYLEAMGFYADEAE